MDLALNKLQRLICDKTQQTNKPNLNKICALKHTKAKRISLYIKDR